MAWRIGDFASPEKRAAVELRRAGTGIVYRPGCSAWREKSSEEFLEVVSGCTISQSELISWVKRFETRLVKTQLLSLVRIYFMPVCVLTFRIRKSFVRDRIVLYVPALEISSLLASKLISSFCLRVATVGVIYIRNFSGEIGAESRIFYLLSMSPNFFFIILLV